MRRRDARRRHANWPGSPAPSRRGARRISWQSKAIRSRILQRWQPPVSPCMMVRSSLTVADARGALKAGRSRVLERNKLAGLIGEDIQGTSAPAMHEEEARAHGFTLTY